MRTLFIIPFLLFIGLHTSSAQESTDLYQTIKGIMKNQLDYTYDETSNQPLDFKKESEQKTNPSALLNTPSSLPVNPAPLVVVNGIPTSIEGLSEYDTDDVAEIHVLGKGNVKAAALYGSRGSIQGTILVKLKE